MELSKMTKDEPFSVLFLIWVFIHAHGHDIDNDNDITTDNNNQITVVNQSTALTGKAKQAWNTATPLASL